MSLRLGIDLDGVVADFSGGWISLYNQAFGTNIPLDAVDSWGAAPRLTHFRHMGEFWGWAQSINGASLFRHLPTFPGAVEALARLARQRHHIVIVTSKPHWAVHDTYEWLAEHQIPTREVHITDDKWRVPCDIYLDDAPHQLVALSQRRPEADVCRFVRKWNDPVDGTFDIADWPEFVDFVQDRAAGSLRRVEDL